KRFLPWLLLFAGGSALTLSCSDDNVGVGSRIEVGAVREAITGGCQTGTYGAPCDPDSAGPLTECQGLCRPDPASPSGKMTCFPISSFGLSNLDGRLCGDDTKCSTVCSGTQCVS